MSGLNNKMKKRVTKKNTNNICLFDLKIGKWIRAKCI